MNRREFNAIPLSLGGTLLLPFLTVLTTQPGCTAPGDSETYLDPEHAGPDYRVQGEYTGAADGQRLGCQVIALGGGVFEAVFLPGGLPGAGWDGQTRFRIPGRSNGDQTVFGTDGEGWQATWEHEQLNGKTAEGKGFTLRKVHRTSPTEGLKPPSGAVVLFDGTHAEEWINGKITSDGLLEPGARTRREFRDFHLHLEFRLPFRPYARGQSRGNSGIYVVNRYEVQVLDSFGLEGKNNECGAIYTRQPPLVNMCFPPLAWQTYDIDFRFPRWNESGEKVENAVITVRHNGVVVQDRYEILKPTGGASYRPEQGERGPINLQNHGNPVRYRNIWLVER